MDVDAVVNRLRESGYRLTPQRLAIFRALAASREHPSAQMLYEELREAFPMISLATVYSTLELLKEMGEIVEVGFSDEGRRYEPNLHPHVNLVCVQCGKIQDFDAVAMSPIEQAVADRSGYQIHGSRVEYFGLCPDCKQVA
ncbi:MAG: transcriptional repressor [Chloroflexi bacterium]|nr:MAG: transcriptional repressor [Chloroflexota bacterium]